MYCSVYLQSTVSNSIFSDFDRFLAQGGWDTLFEWLKHGKDKENVAFLKLLLKLYIKIKPSIELLKTNDTVKVIRTLCKPDSSALEVPDLINLAKETKDAWKKLVTEDKVSSQNEDKRPKDLATPKNTKQPILNGHAPNPSSVSKSPSETSATAKEGSGSSTKPKNKPIAKVDPKSNRGGIFAQPPTNITPKPKRVTTAKPPPKLNKITTDDSFLTKLVETVENQRGKAIKRVKPTPPNPPSKVPRKDPTQITPQPISTANANPESMDVDSSTKEVPRDAPEEKSSEEIVCPGPKKVTAIPSQHVQDILKNLGGEPMDIDRGIRSILKIGGIPRTRPADRRIKWRDDNLTDVQYFELDETERINVTKPVPQGYTEREGAALRNSHNIPPHPGNEARTPWNHQLFLVDKEDPRVEPGCKSDQATIMAERHSGSIQKIYLTKEQIPDSPGEPEDEECPPSMPRTIPLESDDLTTFRDYSQQVVPINGEIYPAGPGSGFGPPTYLGAGGGIPSYTSAPLVPPIPGVAVNSGFVPKVSPVPLNHMALGGPHQAMPFAQPPQHSPPGPHHSPSDYGSRGKPRRDSRFESDRRDKGSKFRDRDNTRPGGRDNTCHQFMKKGFCKFGDQCKFEHPRNVAASKC